MVSVRTVAFTLGVVLLPAVVLPAAAQEVPPQESQPAAQSQPESAAAQPADQQQPEELMSAGTFAGLALRSIGPALMSGRVGDLAVNPDNRAEYYVAVASGGVWKTTNAGITFAPVFDGQGSYSIGCITMDPRNHNVVWVGTGENNSQRSVSFGDGVYVTRDGGKNWENVGLKESEHVGMIAIDPRDSNVVYVAAMGPLWRAGGDRGLYKTIDGGKTWERILHISDDTGVNEVHLDPRDPDVIYAPAYQRRRHVWTLINGGPESAVYKSADGGKSWRKIHAGLPDVELGRVGLAVSPANPDVVYAIVEAAMDKGGFYRSLDRGETWDRMSDYRVYSAQYYNEIFCDPHEVERVYIMDTFSHYTNDGGRTFQPLRGDNRHVDDHALWIDPKNTNYLLIGCDGGVYESYDRGATWRFMANLPISQFYRIACDNSEPFYYVYGGTQDNGSVGAPSRTTDRIGIANEHWFHSCGADGYETCVDPVDPMIVYSLWQYGGLIRFDRRSGESVDIKPREKPGEEPYRWNWDSPLVLSPHSPTRLYFAANILFRSDDRGNSWTALSGDLTRRINRDELPVFGKIQKVDAVAKHNSTSFYGNCVSLSESPLVEGLLYVGTDDGLVQITEDGGKNWRKVETFPEIPERTYVSCLTASQRDPDTVFAAFDNHKMGDFKPYVLKSTDRGRTWTSIAGDLPERHIVYSIQQDHVKPELLFVGTEFGAFFTIDGGTKWFKLAGGMPTIAVRDLDIQRRENDLIVGTFGRSIYILDDYSPLRSVSEEILKAGPILFPIKDAWRYVERSRLGDYNGRGSQGASYYAAMNPPYGAVFTFYLPEKIMSRQELRKNAEQEDEKAGKAYRYPTLDELRAEDRQREPGVYMTICDEAGEVVRRFPVSREKGLHRTSWDMRYPAVTPPVIDLPTDHPPFSRPPAGPLVPPGTYSAMLVQVVDGNLTPLTPAQKFDVVPLELATFAAKDRSAVLAFHKKLARLQRAVAGAFPFADEVQNRINHVRAALRETPGADPTQVAEIERIQQRLNDLLVELRGDPTLAKREEPQPPSIGQRLYEIIGDQWNVTSPPTQTQVDGYRYAGEAFAGVLDGLRRLAFVNLKSLEEQLESLGGPWTPGRLPDWQPE